MTMSELQLHNDSQLGQNTKIINETKLSELVVMGEDDHETSNKNAKLHKNKRQSKKETGKFISSLISQGGDNTAENHQQEDTVYSYLEDDESSDQSLEMEDGNLKKSLKITKKMLKQE